MNFQNLTTFFSNHWKIILAGIGIVSFLLFLLWAIWPFLEKEKVERKKRLGFLICPLRGILKVKNMILMVILPRNSSE